MSKSLDKVLQSDGSYKWELVEHVSEAVREKSKKPVKKPAKAKVVTETPTEN